MTLELGRPYNTDSKGPIRPDAFIACGVSIFQIKILKSTGPFRPAECGMYVRCVTLRE